MTAVFIIFGCIDAALMLLGIRGESLAVTLAAAAGLGWCVANLAGVI